VSFRRLVAAVGVAAAVAGLLSLVAPGLLDPGLDRAAVGVLGGLALLQAGRLAWRRGLGGGDRADPGSPERPRPVEPPGTRLDRVLAGFAEDGTLYQGLRHRRGLAAAAVAVLCRFGGYDEAGAREAIRTGRWTDDAVAAAYLAREPPERSPLAWLRRLLSPASDHARRVARAATAVAAVAGLAPDEPPRRPGRGPFSGTDDADERGPPAPAERATRRWDGVAVVALAGIGAGVLAERPALVLAGAVGVGYAAFARADAAPTPSLAVERRLGTERPEPGDEVCVTVAVTNEGETTLHDLRLIEGVPDRLAVAAGPARAVATLAPGETATVEYRLRARHGVHEFGPVVAIARGLAGTTERTVHAGPEPPTELVCPPRLEPLSESVALRAQTARHAGRNPTATAGEGVEFFATREYRPGDPPGRIDWNRRARTGELATLEFRRERAATVVIVVDVRPGAHVGPAATGPDAVERSVAAAGRLFATLLAAGDRVGLAALDSTDAWLAPGTGPDHRVAGRELLATHRAFGRERGPRPASTRRWTRTLRRRLTGDAQVVLCSPLCEGAPATVATRLEAAGHPVTVLSPDPTVGRDAGTLLARVARRLRAADLRDGGLSVADWGWGESLSTALERHRRSR
jgi:uncharacterized protein (DUF58 family)